MKKNNKGVTLVDVIIAITVLSLFVGVVGSFYYEIAYYNSFIKLNASASYYAVKVAEDIDKLDYSLVNNSLNQTLIPSYEVPNIYTITVGVEDYNKTRGNEGKEDIIKIVTIEVQYQCYNSDVAYKIKKLKYKER